MVEPDTLTTVVKSSWPNSEDAVTEAVDTLDDRYGRGQQRGIDRRIGWAIGIVAVLAGLTFLLFGGWQQGTDIDARISHYEVIDDQTVKLNFDVTAPPTQPVACAIEALSPSFATVGWKVIELPRSEQRTRSLSETMVTTSPATTATVRECWGVEVNNSAGTSG